MMNTWRIEGTGCALIGVALALFVLGVVVGMFL